jgi:hypothetical protein
MINGIYVNWLAVANQVTERSHPFPKHANETERLTHFRRIGLATFLQELVLLIQSGRGWQPHMFLQTNINTRACRYYVKRGYQQAPENNLDSLSFLPAGSFASLPIYFITDATQIQDGTPAKDHLKLHYHLGHMQSSFLEPAISSILPSAEDEPLLEFPFNCNGSLLDSFSNSEQIHLFSEPVFGSKSGALYSTRHTSDPQPDTKIFRKDGMFDSVYDTSLITLSDYQVMDDIEKPLLSCHVDFWSCWMFCAILQAVFEGMLPLYHYVYVTAFQIV